MICKHCGKEIEGEGIICETCKSELITQETDLNTKNNFSNEQEQSYTIPQQNQTTKRPWKKILTISFISLVVLSIFTVSTLAAVNLMKSPKQKYMEMELKNLDSLVSESKDSYTNYYDEKMLN